MKAVIYIRVSTKEQVKNLSLRTQEAKCSLYCKNNGMAVARVFRDEGESAKTLDRPGLQALLRYCEGHQTEVGYVVVYGSSRLSREVYDFLSVLESLSAQEIKLRFVTEPSDETAQGKLVRLLNVGLSQFDNDLRAERTLAGMRAAAELGRWNHIPPLGYLKVKVDGENTSRMVHDPERAPLVRQAFEMFAERIYSRKQVLDRVHALGLRTKKGRRVPSQTFSKMLRNPAYAGWVRVPSWDFTERGDWEPIVDQHTFDMVQLILDGKQTLNTPKLRNNPEFPLRHFVRCGQCGTPMTGSRSKGRNGYYPYYHCRKKECGKARAPKAIMEEGFLEMLDSVRPRRELVRLFRAIVKDVWEQRLGDGLRQGKLLEKRLQGLQGKRDKLVKAHVYKESIGPEDFQRQSSLLDDEMTEVRTQLHEVTRTDHDVERIMDFAEEVLVHGRQLWERYGLDQRQRFQQLVFPEGLEFDGGNYRTAPTCSMFTYLRQIGAAKDHLASPTGIEPVLPP